MLNDKEHKARLIGQETGIPLVLKQETRLKLIITTILANWGIHLFRSMLTGKQDSGGDNTVQLQVASTGY